MSLWSEISKACQLLSQGDVVALPTETVYGLAGNVFNEAAIEKIFAVKDRPSFDPLIVHISSFEEVSKLAQKWGQAEAVLAKAFWPGPLTIVTPKTQQVNPLITAGLESVGIRMPAHPVFRRILRELKTPLAAPSANKFGRTSPTAATHVKSEFSNSVFVVDGGDCQVGIESTVVAVHETAQSVEVKILRPGMIAHSHLKRALEDAHLKKLIRVSNVEASPLAPGHTDTHYQPAIPLIIAHRTPSQETATQIEKKFSFPSLSRYSELNLNPDPRLAARDLYSEMRRLSTSGIKWMFVRKSNDRSGEVWESIWNRLDRAASMRID